MTDEQSRPWATHEPPWAGALDKLAANAAHVAAQGRRRPPPDIRVHQLTEKLEQQANQFDPGWQFWIEQGAAQRAQRLELHDDTTAEADEPQIDEPQFVDVDELPNPLACQCGHVARTELALICHRAVYTDPDHENPQDRIRRALRGARR